MGVETLLMAAGGAQGVGEVFQGIQGYQQGMAEKDNTRAVIGATKIQRDRDLADLRDQNRSSLARMRTIFAAQGGSTGGLQESLILKDQAYQSGVSEARLLQDYDFRLNTLRAVRDNQKRGAMQTLLAGIFKAGTTAVSTQLGISRYQSSLNAPATGSAV